MEIPESSHLAYSPELSLNPMVEVPYRRGLLLRIGPVSEHQHFHRGAP